MSPQEQRIAIAEVVGHKNIRMASFCNDCGAGTDLMSDKSDEWPIPDYLSDLNAMHEVVKTLEPAKMDEFCNCLIYDIVHRYAVDTDGTVKDAGFSVINATATQRAEAFLRTVGKWKE